VDAVTVVYDAVKENHTTMQMALASAKDLLQTLLTGLIRAQELRVVEERVVEARRTLGVREREDAAGKASRDAWWARMREVEIKEHELRLLEGQVGSSNAAWVRVSFSLVFSLSHPHSFSCASLC
jgi:hypothetical protein